jgi:hypothetical protein
MSVIEIKSHPITHIIVRNFLDVTSQQKLVESLLPIRENYLERVTYTDPNGVEKKSTEDTDMFKTGAWLFPLLGEKPELSRDCVEILENNIWRDDLRQAYEDTNDLLFRTYPYSNDSTILFSQYETGEWMTWHTDERNTCSATYVFTFEDRQLLAGGDFLLSDLISGIPPPEKIVTYPHEDNFLIVFPAKALHHITKTTGYRYSLNYSADYRE